MTTSQAPTRKRRPVLWTTAAVAVGAVVVTGAVLADGYDEQEVPRLEPSVWVTRDDGHYARVNTELGEIDTVKAVAEPAGVIQSGSDSMIFTQGYAQAWPVDAAIPLDLVDTSDGESSTAASLSGPTPTGTVQVRTAGESVAYRTATGEVYVSTYPEPGAAMVSPRQLDPYAQIQTPEDEEPPTYVADAMALDEDGKLVMYSREEGAIRTYDVAAGTFVGEPVDVAGGLEEGSDFALTLAGGRWVLLDATGETVWIEQIEGSINVDLFESPRMQSTSSDLDTALIADEGGLVRIDTVEGTASRVAEATGVATAPIVAGGIEYAAWVSTVDATLWDSESGDTTALDTDREAFEDVQAPSPVIRTNGDRAVLSETVTGSLWTLPDGTLLPGSDWDPLDDVEEELGEVDVDDIVEQEPPVAVDDSFGVRAGSTVRLPLLYNDFDPNASDVLTIAPSSMSELRDESFGELSLVSEDQEAVIRVAAESGSTTFTYAATDGYAVSDPATVTLTVIPHDQNSPPEWCGVNSCTQEWPRPQVMPGGFTEVSVLRGWVDPEGDSFVLADARPEDHDAPINVVPTEDGQIAIRHLDPNGSADVLPITVTVVDALGAEATRTLELQVTGEPLLDVRPIAINGAAGSVSRTEITDHVRGGSGSYRLVDAVSSHGGDSLTVTPLPATSTIELEATAPGRYMANYTVEDTRTLAQSSATVRFTVAEEPRPLTIPPLTAFVRAQEDATVDVLESAQHTTDRVLMVAGATSEEPRLSASVVGTSYVRVSGTTDNGEPGVVGVADVTIADGAGNTATTELTVYLLPPAEGRAPIAMPDTASVRGGSQIDIPVLDNDTGPRGERLMLMPEVEGSDTDGELAFGSGKVLRYLAPTSPGTYTLRYTTYIESDVERTDSSTVTVTVLPDGANQAPEPPNLTARVHLGQSVRIPFNGAGVDPDGDAVTLTDVSQPAAAHGTTSVSAAGNAIVYRAPTRPVPDGQVSFTYTVVDEQGLTANATVRVGVLDAEVSDVAPVTYSDYVAAQVGSPDAIPVEPLRNDSDPLQGELSIIDVRPYAQQGTTEYERLEGLFDIEAFEDDGTIKVLPGDVSGTHSYVYTVESSASLSTAEGRIVVDVTEVASPAALQVQDTVLTARTRHDLADGIDVVTGKVQWQGGDAGGLTLSLLDDAPAGLAVSDRSIRGSVPDGRAMVPFALTGVDFTGAEVETFGFLRIPALDDMRIQPRGEIEAIEVEEDSTTTFNVFDRLDLSSADTIELRDTQPFTVQRSNARCEAASSTTATYAAGRDAPWTDTCSVAVRITGQETWSVVAVPVSIVPLEPQAVLSPVSRTIRPAESDTVTLVDELVSWEGGVEGDSASLALTATYAGDAFEVSTTAGVLTATAHADAVPGTRETITVTTPAFGGLSTTITAVVGAAPEDAPVGANFSHSCDVSDGSQCTITVTGVAGEYDPFANATGGGLTLVAVGSGDSVSCPMATVTQASDSQVVVTWPSGQRPEGGECRVNFTVADAQGRTGPGSVTLDVQGYPRAPSSLTTSSFTGNSVTLDVALGPAAQAHPAVTGVTILRGGSPISADCSASGSSTYRCTVSGLENGVPGTYTARAVNAVGESAETSAHTTWAYQAPEVTSVTAESIFVRGTTSRDTGVASVSVTSSEDTRAFRLEGRGQEVARTGNVTSFELNLSPGSHTIRVIPLSEFEPPTEGGSSGSAQQTQVLVGGAPSYSNQITAQASEGTITVSGGTFEKNSSEKETSQIWYAWRADTNRPHCSMNSSGQPELSGGDYITSNSKSIRVGDDQVRYKVAVCGANGYGSAHTNTVTLLNWVEPGPPHGNTSYQINNEPNVSDQGRTHKYTLSSGPSLANENHLTLFYRYSVGAAVTDTRHEFRLPRYVDGNLETIEAVYCAQENPEQCGQPATITAAGAPTEVTVRNFPALAPGVTHPDNERHEGCYPVGSPADYLDGITVSPASGAEKHIRDGKFIVEWNSGPYSNLRSIEQSFELCPEYVEPEPEPEPSPTPTPDPEPSDPPEPEPEPSDPPDPEEPTDPEDPGETDPGDSEEPEEPETPEEPEDPEVPESPELEP